MISCLYSYRFNTCYFHILGWLVDVSGRYSTPFLVFGVVQIFGGLLGLIAYGIHVIILRRDNDPAPEEKDENI